MVLAVCATICKNRMTRRMIRFLKQASAQNTRGRCLLEKDLHRVERSSGSRQEGRADRSASGYQMEHQTVTGFPGADLKDIRVEPFELKSVILMNQLLFAL